MRNNSGYLQNLLYDFMDNLIYSENLLYRKQDGSQKVCWFKLEWEEAE